MPLLCLWILLRRGCCIAIAEKLLESVDSRESEHVVFTEFAQEEQSLDEECEVCSMHHTRSHSLSNEVARRDGFGAQYLRAMVAPAM